MTFTLKDTLQGTICEQIGRWNLMAISGGKVIALEDGVRLPVGYGYVVDVRLNWATDEYSVERVFVRAGTEKSKGKREHVFCDEVGEVAYKASCFRNDDAEYWPEALTS